MKSAFLLTKTVITLFVMYYARVAKCNDDVNHLVPVVAQLSQAVAGLQAKLDALPKTVEKSEPSVIFSVQRSDRRFQISGGTTMLFDQVLFNKAAGYSARHGEFTTPVSGLYHVSFRGWSATEQVGYLLLKLNRSDISELPFGDQNHESASSQSLVLHLQQGDVLSIHVITEGSDITMMGEDRTTFMGYLIQAD